MFSDVSVWLIFALVLFGIELLTTSFYLLMLSLACLAGALTAYLGWNEPAQIAFTALVAVILLITLRRFKHKLNINSRTADLNLDLGGTVEVKAFDVNGMASVDYRGALWQARLQDKQMQAQPGSFVIVAIEGNVLLLSPINQNV